MLFQIILPQRQGVAQQVNAVRGQGRVQTAVSVHDSFVDIQVEDIVLRICQSLQSLIAGVDSGVVDCPAGVILRSGNHQNAFQIDDSIGLCLPYLCDHLSICLCPAFCGACAQFVQPQHDVNLAVLLLCQFLCQGDTLAGVGVAGSFFRDFENGKSYAGEVVRIGQAAIEGKPLGTGVANEKGIVKVGIVYRLKYRRGSSCSGDNRLTGSQRGLCGGSGRL